ncbi:MAG: hypothetical protein WCB94_07465 [Terriglobales bacterium]
MSDEMVGLVQRRRRRSREEAEQLVREYESSGLTRQAFCAGRGMSMTTLDKYRRRDCRVAQSRAGRLVPVEVLSGIPAAATGGGALWVELGNGRRIGVGSGFDAAALRRLLQVVEQA